MSMKSKILVPVIIMVVVMVAAILISVNLVFSDYVEKTVIEEIDTYSKVVDNNLNALKDRATLNSELLSMDDVILQGVIDGNRDALYKRALELMESSTVDFCTILDEYGNVMLRVHEPDNYGDSLANQMNISRALKGEPLTTVETGTAVRFSVRCGQPIINENGVIVGVVSSGYRLDQNNFVDEMKELTGAEVTVFLGDERISTTILNAEGERAIGTKADEAVSKQVLDGIEYSGRAQILGNSAYVKYIPIREVDDNIIGMLFVGRFTSTINATKSYFVSAGIIVAAVVLLIMAPALYLLIKRMTKSIKKMADIAKEIADGSLEIKVDVKGKDETSMLAHAFNDMINTIKTLVLDMKYLAAAAYNGELSTRVDSSKHKGEYRAIVEGINETLDAVVAPIQNAAGVLGEVKNGNLNVEMTGNYNGEHAIIQEALNDTIHHIRFYIDEIKGALTSMANGDFAICVTSDFQGDFVELKDAINFISSSLSMVMSNINDAAVQVAAGSQQVSDGSQEVSQGATEQAGSIEELTETIAKIAGQTHEMALNVNEVAKIARANKDDAEIGKKHMQNMQEAMREINASSLSISKIIKVIDDIAFQTNILALNAAVEAARAGVHGKGFAVVAEEVRSLATKSANAAKETTAMIESSIDKANIGTTYANEAMTSFSAIADVIERAVTALDDIGKAANEQATGIGQVNKGIEQLSMVVQTNSATSQEAAATTEQLSSQADMLKQLVRQFKLNDIATKKDSGKPYIALPPLRVVE